MYSDLLEYDLINLMSGLFVSTAQSPVEQRQQMRDRYPLILVNSN